MQTWTPNETPEASLIELKLHFNMCPTKVCCGGCAGKLTCLVFHQE